MMHHRKGGRPKSKLGEERSEWISLRLTSMELSIIKYKAKLLGKSVRAYVRDLAVTSEAKPSMTPEQIAVVRDLDGVANNLNQLARWANTYHEYDPIKIQVERILNKIESIEDQLLL